MDAVEATGGDAVTDRRRTQPEGPELVQPAHALPRPAELRQGLLEKRKPTQRFSTRLMRHGVGLGMALACHEKV
jgi:hypothetical protein